MAAGRNGLPSLAMGSDDESQVHVGIDRAGAVVRLDLEPDWRAALGPAALGGAVAQAVRQAGDVRCGDWAASVASATVSLPAAGPQLAALDARDRTTSVSTQTPPSGMNLHLDTAWISDADDADVRAVLLQRLSIGDGAATANEPHGARPVQVVRTRLRHTRTSLRDGALALPTFMRAPLQAHWDRVHADVVEALELPISGQQIAAQPLAAYATELNDCAVLAVRPAALPEASQIWADSSIRLLGGLAAIRGPNAGWFRRRQDADPLVG